LPDDEIYAIGKDKAKGLWLSHGFGISRVNYSLPLRNFDSYPGIDGNLISVIDFDSTIYAATTEGVYYLTEVKDYKEIEVMVKVRGEPFDEYIVVENPEESVIKQETTITLGDEQKQEQKKKKKTWRERLKDKWFSKKNKENKKETGSGKKKKTIKNNEEINKQTPTKQTIIKKRKFRTRYESQKTFALQSIRKMFKKINRLNEKCKQMVVYRDRLLIATNTGLYEIMQGRVTPIVKGKYINYIAPSKYTNRLYIGAGTGLFSIFFDEDNSTWNIENNFDDFNENVHSILESDSTHIWLGCENIAYKIRLDSIAAPDTIVSYYFMSVFSERIVVRNVNNEPYFFLSSGVYYYDAEKDIIVHDQKFLSAKISNSKQIYSQDSLTWLYNEGEWHFVNNMPEIRFLKELYFNLFDDIQNIYVDSLKNMWIIDGKSIHKILSLSQQKVTRDDFCVYIKGVSNTQGILFTLENLVLSNDNNSIEFTIAAPFFVKSQSTQYQYILRGLMSNWSKWGYNSHVEFPYIPSGKFL
jgi:ligand-binding sensor domain-containing protein